MGERINIYNTAKSKSVVSKSEREALMIEEIPVTLNWARLAQSTVQWNRKGTGPPLGDTKGKRGEEREGREGDESEQMEGKRSGMLLKMVRIETCVS